SPTPDSNAGNRKNLQPPCVGFLPARSEANQRGCTSECVLLARPRGQLCARSQIPVPLPLQTTRLLLREPIPACQSLAQPRIFSWAIRQFASDSSPMEIHAPPLHPHSPSLRAPPYFAKNRNRTKRLRRGRLVSSGLHAVLLPIQASPCRRN